MLIDPKDRTVVIVRPGGDLRILESGEQLDLGDAIPGLRLEVAAIFAALRLENPDHPSGR